MAPLSFGALLLVVLPAARANSDTVPLYADLGSYHRSITTGVPDAQRYFDQGLRLVFGFNHAEAIRAFTEAARLDPTCAMCFWGIAYAHGPHVNAGMDSASGVAAYAAAQKAQSLARRIHPRVHVRAMGVRESPDAHGAGRIEARRFGERADRRG